MDKNTLTLVTGGSFGIYLFSLKDGYTAQVTFEIPDEVTDITYSEKSIYDIILEKDMPENILGKEQ